MDELSEKLAGILNDPESMERIRNMAESILSPETAKDSGAGDTAAFENLFSGGEIGAFINIANRLKSMGSDPRTALLEALKPNLSEPRRQKVDTAIKILKIIEILPAVRETGLIDF